MKRIILFGVPALLATGSLPLAWRGLWIEPSLAAWPQTRRVQDLTSVITCPIGGSWDSLSTPFATIDVHGGFSSSGRFSWQARECVREEMEFVSYVQNGLPVGSTASKRISLQAPHVPSEVALLDSQTFFVAGPPLDVDYEEWAQNPVTLVTRWTLIQPEGTPAFRRTRRHEPLGVPAEEAGIQMVLVGEDYVPADRRDDPHVSHHLVARLPFACDDLVADPDGRYLIALDSDEGHLHRVDLLDPAHPVQLISDSPRLVDSSWLRLRRHAAEDAKTIVVEDSGGALLMWLDHDNTGDYEDHRTLEPVPGDGCGDATSIDWSDMYGDYLMTFRSWTEVLGY